MGGTHQEVMMAKVFRQRLVDPIKQLLIQGITPEKIALSLALGIPVGLGVYVGVTGPWKEAS